MASASSQGHTAEDSFNCGSTIDDVLSCPVCLELFTTPKVMPSCGHSVCLHCVSKIVQLSTDSTRVSCPECRVVSPLGSLGVQGLRTNIQLQRTVALYEVSTSHDAAAGGAGSRTSDSFHDPCPHVFLTKAPLSCDHCGTKFCNGCGIAHMEKMKVEMMDLVGGFRQRLEASEDGLEAKLENVRRNLDEQLETTRSEIIETVQKLETDVRSLVEQAQTSLIAKADAAREDKWAEIGAVVTHGRAIDSELDDRLRTLSSKSVLNCGLVEIAELYSQVSKRHNEILALEKLRSEPLSGKINFKIETSLETDVISALKRLQDIRLKWQSLQEIENMELQQATAAIHSAAKSGDLDALKAVLESDGLPEARRRLLVERVDDNESPNHVTPLMQAAKSGQLDIMRYLIEQQGAGVRTTASKRGVVCIHLACQCGHIDVVRYLLEHDPELLKVRNHSGATPLAYAVHHGHLNLTRMLIEEKGLDVEEIGVAGKTPLMEAAAKGHLAVVDFLLGRHADLYARQPKTGNIAAHLAAMAGSAEALRYLLGRRPDLLIVKNYKGQTLIDMASDPAIVRLLEERGARRRAIFDF